MLVVGVCGGARGATALPISAIVFLFTISGKSNPPPPLHSKRWIDRLNDATYTDSSLVNVIHLG